MDQATLQTAFKMTLALGAVLLVFGGTILLVRKFAMTSKGFLRKGARDAVKPMEILAFQSLGPGRSLYLIRCLDKKFLIGASNAQINAISNIEDSDEAAAATEAEFKSTLREKMPEKRKESLLSELGSSLKNISRV